jgi:hypothetical protein
MGLSGATGTTGAQGIQGLKGDTGAAGKTVLNGTIAPTTQGTIGDFYLDTVAKKIYGPKTDAGWGAGVALVGPQGIQGATGTQGPQGIQGPKGDIGVTGATGPQGPIGLTGAQGPKGDTGLQGATGTTGSAGANGKSILNGMIAPAVGVGVLGDFYLDTVTNRMYGPKTDEGWGDGVALVGPQGPQGPQGLTGATGATGPQGLKGDTGAAGATGAQGIQGPVGLTGDQGEKGEKGDAGLKGDTGVAGKTVLNGMIAPAVGVGVLGDFYLDTVTNRMYGPKTDEGWGAGVSLVGPQGVQGPAGSFAYSSECTYAQIAGTWVININVPVHGRFYSITLPIDEASHYPPVWYGVNYTNNISTNVGSTIDFSSTSDRISYIYVDVFNGGGDSTGENNPYAGCYMHLLIKFNSAYTSFVTSMSVGYLDMARTSAIGHNKTYVGGASNNNYYGVFNASRVK